MERSELPPESHELVKEMWSALIEVRPGNVAEQAGAGAVDLGVDGDDGASATE